MSPKGIESVGAFLVQMVSMSLSQLRDPTKFKKTMTSLAARHCERGVKASEYGVIGEVLFYSLKKCLGEETYTTSVEISWKKIYSVMLREIVPLVVRYERTGKFIDESRPLAARGSEEKQKV
jgi:hemoglobin-like flavoprotein